MSYEIAPNLGVCAFSAAGGAWNFDWARPAAAARRFVSLPRLIRPSASRQKSKLKIMFSTSSGKASAFTLPFLRPALAAQTDKTTIIVDRRFLVASAADLDTTCSYFSPISITLPCFLVVTWLATVAFND